MLSKKQADQGKPETPRSEPINCSGLPVPTIYTAKYLLLDNGSVLPDGALLVAKGRIQAVGTRRQLCAEAPAARLVEYREGILLPPLVNAHTHLELTDFPRWAEAAGELAEPTSFVDWIKRVIRIKRSLQPESYQQAVRRGIAAVQAAGTGAVGDVLSRFSARAAFDDAALFGRLYFEAVGCKPEGTTPLRLQLARLLHEGPCGNLQPGLAPHAPYSLSAAYLADIFSLAKGRGIPTTIHLAESPAEASFLFDASGPLVEDFYPLVGWDDAIPAASGLSPVGYLKAHGGLAHWNLLVHGVQVDAADIADLVEARCSMVLCLRSNSRLGVGLPPLDLYRQYGVRLALGTDSLASNDSLSLWDELAFAWPRLKSVGYAAADALQMVTRNGAQALGLEGVMGRLQPGYGAHFQVLELPTELQPDALPLSLCEQAAALKVSNLVLSGNECLPIPG